MVFQVLRLVKTTKKAKWERKQKWPKNWSHWCLEVKQVRKQQQWWPKGESSEAEGKQEHGRILKSGSCVTRKLLITTPAGQGGRQRTDGKMTAVYDSVKVTGDPVQSDLEKCGQKSNGWEGSRENGREILKRSIDNFLQDWCYTHVVKRWDWEDFISRWEK